MFRGALGRAGVFTFVIACLVSFLAPSLPNNVRSISVARAFATAAAEKPGQAPERVRDVARAEVVLGVQATPVATVEPAAAATPEPTPLPTPAGTAAAAVVATLLPLPDPPTGGIVIASWYGPGFYGNRTACGQVYTPEIIGVAHRTLRCGTMLVLEYRGRTMTVPVIDRGPYIAGRTLDHSNATRLAMGCPDLCTLSMRIAP
ncbi:MAG TPA: septal ring lytic transglycosylase RlpA family protein [Candidatus Limnocylindria bacterium]